MSASLWDQTLRAALADTASAKATPGGGSIAPITGAFGLGLVLMALEVTRKKAATPALDNAIERGRTLLGTLSEHADRDVAVFDAYMQALALPKQTEAEQALRASAREGAVSNAAHTPLTAAEVTVRALEYAESVASLVQQNVWSDLVAGADLLAGSLKAVLRTVAINLPSLKDLTLREQLEARSAQLAEQGRLSYARICAYEAP